MKRFIWLTATIVVLAATAAFAGVMTWQKPLPSPTDATLGYNEQAVKNAAALTEIRDRVKALGVFAGYSTQGN